MSVRSLVSDLKSVAQRLTCLNELDRSSLSVDDAVYVLKNFGVSDLDWNKRSEIASKFRADYVDSIVDEEELIDAISRLETRASNPRSDLSKHKKVILKVLKTTTDKSVRTTISNWEIAWNRAEISQLPQSYLDEQLHAYWRRRIHFDTTEEADDRDEYERPRKHSVQHRGIVLDYYHDGQKGLHRGQSRGDFHPLHVEGASTAAPSASQDPQILGRT